MWDWGRRDNKNPSHNITEPSRGKIRISSWRQTDGHLGIYGPPAPLDHHNQHHQFYSFYKVSPDPICSWVFSWCRNINSRLREREKYFLIRLAVVTVVFLARACKYISHSDHCGGLASLIRTNQICEIVTPYQYIHQNTNTTQPNHHLLWTNMIVLRSEKSMSDLTRRNNIILSLAMITSCHINSSLRLAPTVVFVCFWFIISIIFYIFLEIAKWIHPIFARNKIFKVGLIFRQ